MKPTMTHVHLKTIAEIGSPGCIDPAAELLDKARSVVTGARRQSYGNPEDNFKAIAELWTSYLRRRGCLQMRGGLQAIEVAALMVLMKIARLAETEDHDDSMVDIAGYAACMKRCAVAAENDRVRILAALQAADPGPPKTPAPAAAKKLVRLRKRGP